jgi:electron transfer flavoprotein beta subunit
MKILVCISNVPDTTTKVRFVNGNTEFDSNGVQWIINPWDELALTRAVELKEDANTPVDSVTVINVGESFTEPTLRKCLAIGADNAVRVNGNPRDAYFTANQLAEYVKQHRYDFIICGIESSDFNSSAVGGMIAEILGIPSISSVSGISFPEGTVQIQRDVAGGLDQVSVTVPVVLIVQKGFARVPRIPNMRGIMNARKKPLEVLEAKDCNHLIEFVNYDLPPSKSEVKLFEISEMSNLVEAMKTDANIF